MLYEVITVLANRYATPDEERLAGQALIQEPVTVTATINLHELDKSGGLYQAFTNTSLRLFAVEETDTSWNIYHRRYGHGVGMSQRGAQTRARITSYNVCYTKLLRRKESPPPSLRCASCRCSRVSRQALPR